MFGGKEDGWVGVVVCGCPGSGRAGGSAGGCLDRVQDLMVEWL